MNVDSLETRVRAGPSGIRILIGQKYLSLLQKSQRPLGPNQHYTQWLPGYVPGGKAAGT